MAKSYYLKFGTGDSAAFTGLSPTFTIFNLGGVTATAAPGITETPAGSGLYRFDYEPVQSVLFKSDGGAALATTDRFIYGTLDPIQAVDEKMGTTSDSYGSTNTDPASVFGFLKRGLEFNEGNAVFVKSTGLWDIYSRGSTTLLREKTLTNTTTSATKT